MQPRLATEVGPAPEARRAARGFLWITFAKVYFMAAGAIIEFVLPHLLLAAERARLFGIYKVVVGIVSVLNNVIVTVTIQSVSKFVAEDDARQGQVARTGFRLMAMVGTACAAGFVLLAPALGAFEHDPSLVPHLRLAAGIVLAYSIYSVFVGIANGRREFHKQASLDMTFSTLRALGILGCAAAFLSVGGAIGGFVAAAVAIVGIAALIVRVPPRGEAAPFPAARLGAFFGQLGVYTLLLNLLLACGLLLLKRYSGHRPELPGYYGAAQTLSVLTYQGIIAVIFVIFPLVSRATFEGDAERTRVYVERAMRYSLLLAAAFAVVLGAKPAELLRVPYPAEFAAGAAALRALSLGFVGFSLIAIAGAILNGAGRTAHAIAAVGGTLALAAAANVISLPGTSDPLRTAAWATSASMLVGLAGTGVLLRRSLGAFIPAASVLRVGLAVAAALAAARLMPSGGRMMTILECMLAFAIYAAMLVLVREIRGQDLARVRAVLGAKR